MDGNFKVLSLIRKSLKLNNHGMNFVLHPSSIVHVWCESLTDYLALKLSKLNLVHSFALKTLCDRGLFL